MSLPQVRLALFRLLQAAYAAPPTADLAEALAEAAAVYAELIGIQLPPLAPPEQESAEFHRLFVGPGALVAPPYESVYRSPEQVLMQAETLAVRAMYRQYGLALRPDLNEPDDHIAFELEFYAILQERNLVAAQQAFWQEHLNRWIPAFCRRVIEGSRSPFYRSLAAITRQVIAAEPYVLDRLGAKEEISHEEPV
jgi:TorA maturation chaperone TorD